jgi:peptidoglycan/LPS O-acetylase OafA/YrhL
MGELCPRLSMPSELPQPDRFTNLQEAMKSRRIPMLDVVRALAALLVVVDHYRLTRGVTGTIGVTIFFALSGYLITTLLLAENRKTGSISLSQFYRRRIFRILPAFYVFWFVYVGIMLFTRETVPWDQALSSFFHYSNYYWGLTGKAPIMSITWSLSIEEQFYLLWPLLFYFCRRNTEKMIAVSLVVIFGSLICRWFELTVLHLKIEYLMYAFEARADSLILGCLFAILVFTSKARPIVNIVAATSWLIPLTLAGLIISGIYTVNNTYNTIWRSCLEAILACILIAQLLALPSKSWWNVVNNPVLRYIGQISYSLYLYHGLCRRLVEEAFGIHGLYAVASLGMLVSVFIASVSYYVVEKTFVELGRRSQKSYVGSAGAKDLPTQDERPHALVSR